MFRNNLQSWGRATKSWVGLGSPTMINKQAWAPYA